MTFLDNQELLPRGDVPAPIIGVDVRMPSDAAVRSFLLGAATPRDTVTEGLTPVDVQPALTPDQTTPVPVRDHVLRQRERLARLAAHGIGIASDPPTNRLIISKEMAKCTTELTPEFLGLLSVLSNTRVAASLVLAGTKAEGAESVSLDDILGTVIPRDPTKERFDQIRATLETLTRCLPEAELGQVDKRKATDGSRKPIYDITLTDKGRRASWFAASLLWWQYANEFGLTVRDLFPAPNTTVDINNEQMNARIEVILSLASARGKDITNPSNDPEHSRSKRTLLETLRDKGLLVAVPKYGVDRENMPEYGLPEETTDRARSLLGLREKLYNQVELAVRTGRNFNPYHIVHFPSEIGLSRGGEHQAEIFVLLDAMARAGLIVNTTPSKVKLYSVALTGGEARSALTSLLSRISGFAQDKPEFHEQGQEDARQLMEVGSGGTTTRLEALVTKGSSTASDLGRLATLAGS